MENTARVVSFVWVISVLCSVFSMTASAAAGTTEVPGKIYTFDGDSHYEFSGGGDVADTGAENTYGTFLIGGDVSNVSSKDGVPVYEVGEGNLDLYYNYNDTLLNAGQDAWHLTDDDSKKVDSFTLDDDVMKGAIILQTSKDRKIWIDAFVMTNAFSDMPIRTEPVYSTLDVQLINGCFYRVIVVYELRIRTEESSFLFINTDKYDYKKYAEIYEFYAYTDSGEMNAGDPNQTYSLGNKVRVEDFDEYSGENTIDAGDIHYGWELGNFFVSGYTDAMKTPDGNMVFLKNLGDKVTLWFKLLENINGLNGKDNLSITADTDGADRYFETPTMDFGRGVLIVRYTDHHNVKAKPNIYTNYLEANAMVGADTKVQLFEEGDYEVALNYEVTKGGLIDKISHYRIFFKFSVRNGNCMVYPFDIATGSELKNSAMTENGFRLDLAKSRYLKINLKREMLTEGADGLVEDTRFNGPAKDGAEYKDEGIYTITVRNEYTGQFTTKKIYVGTNRVLRAYMATGLSIPEINDLVARGAAISDDGTIQMASVVSSAGDTETSPAENLETSSAAGMENLSETGAQSMEAGSPGVLAEKKYTVDIIVLVSLIGAAACAVTALILVLKNKKARQERESKNRKTEEQEI